MIFRPKQEDLDRPIVLEGPEVGLSRPLAPIRYESLVDLIRRPLPVAPSWVNPAVVPKRAKGIIGGNSKAGKSFICLEYCKALATGRPLFGNPSYTTERAKVLYVEQEIGLYGLQSRAATFLDDVDLDDIHDWLYYISKDTDMLLDKPEGYRRLCQAVGDLKPNVVILDPASCFLEGSDSDGRLVNQVWRDIDKLLEKHQSSDLTVIFSHHYRKPAGDDKRSSNDQMDINNVRGASQWVAAPDMIQTTNRETFNRKRDEWLVTTRFETRLGPPGPTEYLLIRPNQKGNVVTRVTEEDYFIRKANGEVDALLEGDRYQEVLEQVKRERGYEDKRKRKGTESSNTVTAIKPWNY